MPLRYVDRTKNEERDSVARKTQALLRTFTFPQDIVDGCQADLSAASAAECAGGGLFEPEAARIAGAEVNAFCRVAKGLVDYANQCITQSGANFSVATGLDYFDFLTLARRIPSETQNQAGVDAAILAVLGLVPSCALGFIAQMHANQSLALYDEAKRGIQALKETGWSPNDKVENSPVCWWLAACSVVEPNRTMYDFAEQVAKFIELKDDAGKRVAAARTIYERMKESFQVREINGVPCPIGQDPGSQIGAFLEGHVFAVLDASNLRVYFLATPAESLGLEGFAWSAREDSQGRPMSGPVHASKEHASKKYVKCCDLDELGRALVVVRDHFGES